MSVPKLVIVIFIAILCSILASLFISLYFYFQKRYEELISIKGTFIEICYMAIADIFKLVLFIIMSLFIVYAITTLIELYYKL